MSSKKILAALALAVTGASATQWTLADTYDKTNFFDKFDFFSQPDPTFGHVNYRTREDATALGLVGVEGDNVFLRAHTGGGVGEEGRSSVRIESKALYDHGLFIARFAKVPTPTCGVWPAFWTYGEPWVEVGEVDIIEQWNDRKWNQPAIHTGRSSKFGACTLEQSDMRASVLTSNCDNSFSSPPSQYEAQGCTVSDASGPWGSASEAGVYAMEWTSDFLKLYSFTGANVPTNIDSENPDTASWGKPMMMVKNENCDIDEHFARQKLVFNIDFCGNPAGNEFYWKEESKCAEKTGYETCVEYVNAEGQDFADAHYKIRDIRVFSEGGAEPSAEPSGDPEPSAEPTEDPQPTEDLQPTAEPTDGPAPTDDPEPTAEEPTAAPTVCDAYECPEKSTGTDTESPQPTVCDTYECEHSSAVESSSPQPTVCDSYECQGSSIESSSPEPTACDSYECQESSIESSSPKPTVCDSYECQESSIESSSPQSTLCDEEEEPSVTGTESEAPQPTGCSGHDCQEPTSIESSSPEPTEEGCDEEPEPTSTVGANPTQSGSPQPGCVGAECPETPVESSSPVPGGCNADECPETPVESSSPVLGEECHGAECPEPVESSSPVPGEGCHGADCYPEEPLEPSSPEVGGYPETGAGNGTDSSSPVPSGPVQASGVRAGVSLGLVVLVAFVAL